MRLPWPAASRSSPSLMRVAEPVSTTMPSARGAGTGASGRLTTNQAKPPPSTTSTSTLTVSRMLRQRRRMLVHRIQRAVDGATRCNRGDRRDQDDHGDDGEIAIDAEVEAAKQRRELFAAGGAAPPSAS